MDEGLSDCVCGIVGLGGYVGDDWGCGVVKRDGLDRLLEFFLGGRHEWGVVGAGDGEGDGLACAGGFGELAGAFDGVIGSGDDELAGAIEVGEVGTGFFAGFAGSGFVEADDGGHAALGRVAGFLHECPAGAYELESIEEAEGLRGGEGGKFSEGETCGGLELEVGVVFLEELEGDPADEVDGGLGVFGLGEFIG